MTREDLVKKSERQINFAIQEMARKGCSNQEYIVVLGDMHDPVASTFLHLVGCPPGDNRFYAAVTRADGFKEFLKEALDFQDPALDTIKDASIGETHVCVLGDGGISHFSIFAKDKVN